MIKTFVILFISFMSCINSYANYSISRNGMESIKSYESLSLTSYWDSNGYSIGYGHHSKEVKKGQKISRTKAERYFQDDIKKVNKSINSLIGSLGYNVKFSQCFIDGLGDLIYNCGEGAVRNSTFFKRLKNCRVNKKNGKINKNDWEYTVSAVKTMKISSKGHKKRRYNTHLLMLK